jgi:hypothetical protein
VIPVQSVVAWPDIISACAAAANVILVAVLIFVTWKYAKTTAEILEESRKAREATEQLIKAAQSQASAAHSQATAAYETLHVLRQEVQDLSGLGQSVVQSAIQSAMSAIEYWKRQALKDLAKFQAIPPTDDLVPANAHSAVEHARRIHPSGAQLLSATFDNLRRAREEIESMRQASSAQGLVGVHIASMICDPEKYLTAAMDGLLKAQQFLVQID